MTEEGSLFTMRKQKMNPEIFATFLSRQGHQIIKTDSCYWYNAHPGFYFYFPYHQLINPSKAELNKVLWGKGCIGVRYFTPMECSGKLSYLILCSDKNYDITSVDADYARRQTRRGLENFEIKPLSLKELAEHGNKLNFDTLTRQGRDPRILSEKKWRHYCVSTEGLDGFEAWGAYKEGKLASYLMGFQMGDHFTILYQSSATEYLRLYPNNALIFTVTKLILSKPEITAISYGPESLDAPESLDTFKFRMGYSKSPMRQRILFNPLVRPFIGRLLHKVVKLFADKRTESDTLRKVDGIFNFYRDTP